MASCQGPVSSAPTPGTTRAPTTSAVTAPAERPVVTTTGPVVPSQVPRSPAEQSALDAALRAAAWANDVPRAAVLVAKGADVNAKDETQQSAYLVATSEGYLELLDLTLANGAKVDDLDSWNGTGLIRAAERGHAPVVGRLLRAGIARDHVNRIGYQAIHEAVWLGRDTPEYLDTVRLLGAGGATLTRPSVREGLTPVQMAARRGFDGLTASLTRLVAGQPPPDPAGALLGAAASGSADSAALALRAGADPTTRDPLGRTPLAVAGSAGHSDVVRLLVAMSAAE